jgi:branched-chain amino acid transport system substrate-binding protein
LVKIGQDAVEGNYFSTHYAPDLATEKSRSFVAAYQKRFDGKTPDAMAALGYDSVMILADAIKRAGTTDGPKVRDALAATKDFDGVTGKTSINEKRDATKPAVILQVKNGKFKYIETVNP